MTDSIPKEKHAATKILQLAVTGEYFDAMKSGEKTFEFRLQTSYWRKRLEDREYDTLVITRGYPRKDDASRRLVMSYRGYEKQVITHKHFGTHPVSVFAIRIGELHG
ncbi:RNA-binding protein [Gibbsiella quercinecans]|uniref:ASCH domain-containing protein n=1 Tax=Gibbsiella quercinecans TaxID=929813 RepID=UPI000EF2071D|nr:ASCH domain-containing protein [Gibbsiella quercinecans]RLM02418.1 RNA-binding protein [Gibbsiella quercinecans]